MPRHTNLEGITTTQFKAAPSPDKCCRREGPHVHYVPRKPPVNAAGDVDVFDASNQPSMDIDAGTVAPGIPVDMTEYTPEPIQEVEEYAVECTTCGARENTECQTAGGNPVPGGHAARKAYVTETEEVEDAEVQE